jgi:hypothetical protein
MSASDTIEDPDRGLREWLRDYARQHPRWGHRRAYHDARAQGWVVNHKKVQRLWRQEGLCVPVPRRRKRAGSSTHLPVPTAEAPNVVWAIDFQYDSTTDGRPIKILSAVDEHTRECLGGLVERSITAERLANELDDIVADRGVAPRVLRLDNGPEMIAAALAEWPARVWGCCLFRRARRGAILSSNRSMVGYAMNASTSTCSGRWPTRASSLAIGSRNTTITDRTRRSATSRLRATPPLAAT